VNPIFGGDYFRRQGSKVDLERVEVIRLTTFLSPRDIKPTLMSTTGNTRYFAQRCKGAKCYCVSKAAFFASLRLCAFARDYFPALTFSSPPQALATKMLSFFSEHSNHCRHSRSSTTSPITTCSVQLVRGPSCVDDYQNGSTGVRGSFRFRFRFTDVRVPISSVKRGL
jgi:hypothetical protein